MAKGKHRITVGGKVSGAIVGWLVFEIMWILGGFRLLVFATNGKIQCTENTRVGILISATPR